MGFLVTIGNVCQAWRKSFFLWSSHKKFSSFALCGEERKIGIFCHCYYQERSPLSDKSDTQKGQSQKNPSKANKKPNRSWRLHSLWIKPSLKAHCRWAARSRSQSCSCFCFRELSRVLCSPIRDIIQMLIQWHWLVFLTSEIYWHVHEEGRQPRSRKVEQSFTWVAILRLTHSVQTKSNSVPECSGSRMTPGRQGKCMHSELKLELGLNSHNLDPITDIFNICLLITKCSRLLWVLNEIPHVNHSE